jgi:hypothetical protein
MLIYGCKAWMIKTSDEKRSLASEIKFIKTAGYIP